VIRDRLGSKKADLHLSRTIPIRSILVSVRIYNVLQQFVATPTALSHPSGQAPLVDLEYVTPGRYEAYWDGLDQSGREVASGIYFVQLTVNGATAVMRMYVAK
jgi:hypothetical protein